jgi:hypothetical protein
MTFPLNEIRPGRLPAGYAYRGRTDGPLAGGFGGQANQATLVHTRDRSPREHANPLTVHVIDVPQPALAGTEGRAGTPIDLGRPGVEAVYHDGMWHVDADVADESGVDAAFFWLTTVHSITIRTGRRVYAVRAPRDLPLADLFAVAASLPLR